MGVGPSFGRDPSYEGRLRVGPSADVYQSSAGHGTAHRHGPEHGFHAAIARTSASRSSHPLLTDPDVVDRAAGRGEECSDPGSAATCARELSLVRRMLRPNSVSARLDRERRRGLQPCGEVPGIANSSKSSPQTGRTRRTPADRFRQVPSASTSGTDPPNEWPTSTTSPRLPRAPLDRVAPDRYRGLGSHGVAMTLYSCSCSARKSRCRCLLVADVAGSLDEQDVRYHRPQRIATAQRRSGAIERPCQATLRCQRPSENGSGDQPPADDPRESVFSRK